MQDLLNEFLDIFKNVFSSVFDFFYDFIFDGDSFACGLGSKLFGAFSNAFYSGNFVYYIVGLIAFCFILKLVVSVIRG